MSKNLPDIEVLPAAFRNMGGSDESPATMEDLVFAPYVDVHANSDEARVLESDIKVINNHLIANDFALQKSSSTAAICALATSACKLLEVRRKVKGMTYGSPVGVQGKVWETAEDD